MLKVLKGEVPLPIVVLNLPDQEDQRPEGGG